MQFSASCLLFFLAGVPSAFAIPTKVGRGDSYSTVTISSVSSTVITTPTDISIVVKKSGVRTIIPNVLTMTFLAVPATLSLHTKLVSTSYTTILSTSKVLIAGSTVKGDYLSKTSTTMTASKTTSATSKATSASFTCGVEGYSKDGSSYITDFACDNIARCYTECQETSNCESFDFKPSTGHCFLWANYLQVVAQAGTGDYFLARDTDADLNTCTGSPLPAVPTTGTYKCGQQGRPNLSMSTSESVDLLNTSAFDCKNTCSYTTPCQSYSYDPTTMECVLYYHALDITPSTTSGTYFESKNNSDDPDNCWSG